MIRAFVLFLFLPFSACDLDGPFNKIPCKYSFEELHDTLKVYGLSSYGGEPVGFRGKQSYDINMLDTTSWNIHLSIDSPNKLLFKEGFVFMLSQKVFNDPLNVYFQHICFQLRQTINSTVPGSVELFYILHRDIDSNSLMMMRTALNVQTPRKIGEGTGSAGKYGDWKIVMLEVDSIPKDAFQIAQQYRQTHEQFDDVEISVSNLPSKICKSIKYKFWFGNENKMRPPY